MAFVVVVTLLQLLALGLAQQDCGLTGQCTESTLLSEKVAYSENDCIRFCQQNVTDCSYYTFYPPSGTCLAYLDCNSVSQTCQDCVYGQVLCNAPPQCKIEGRCQGPLVDLKLDVGDYEACLSNCMNNNDCGFFAYNQDDKSCSLLRRCDNIDVNCVSCISGERVCNPDLGRVLLISGAPNNIGNVELIYLRPTANADPGCRPPPNITGASSSWLASGGTINGYVVVCGDTNTAQCIYYDPKGPYDWFTYDVMDGIRIAAGYANVNDSHIWITGGEPQNFGNPRSTSQIATPTGLIPGPPLPRPMARHCAVQLNETHTILIGGIDNTSNYVYNHQEQTWLQIDDLVTQRRHHACVLLPSGRVFVIGGYEDNGSTYLSSTLIIDPKNNFEFSSGASLPLRISGGSAVLFDNEVYFIGGYATSQYIYYIQIYNEELNKWRFSEHTLNQARGYAMAIPITEEQLYC